jgi:outer membrane protein assembly factor BamB
MHMNPFKSVVIIAIAVLSSCTGRQDDMSATFHSNPQHTGFYDTKGPEQFHGIKWSFETGGRVVSSPVVAGNKLFIGSDDSTLYALDVEDGSLLWKFQTGGRVSSSAAVDENRVYVISFDGFVYCVDAETGKEIWKFKTAGERVFAAPGIHGVPEKDRLLDDPWDVYLSSPVIGNGNVYVGCGAGIFYALDAKTGTQKWEYPCGDVIHASPALADSTVYFGSWDSYLYALNTTDGSLKWKFKTGIDTVYYNQVGFQSSPVVYNGVVYSGCRDAHVWAVDAQTGELKWKYYNNGSWVISTPAVHNDTLWFTTSDTHKLIALNALNGNELYAGNCRTYGYSSPAITPGMIYVGNFGGSLLAFNAKTGNQSWEFKTGAARLNRDSILNAQGEFNLTKVFTENSYKGMVNAVDRLCSLGAVLSSPALSEGVVFFGSADGNVYAVH